MEKIKTFNSKEAWKEKIRTKNRWDKLKTKSKKRDINVSIFAIISTWHINPNILIISLNVICLNALNKR